VAGKLQLKRRIIVTVLLDSNLTKILLIYLLIPPHTHTHTHTHTHAHTHTHTRARTHTHSQLITSSVSIVESIRLYRTANIDNKSDCFVQNVGRESNQLCEPYLQRRE
jgi:hypothetical protein